MLIINDDTMEVTHHSLLQIDKNASMPRGFLPDDFIGSIDLTLTILLPTPFLL